MSNWGLLLNTLDDLLLDDVLMSPATSIVTFFLTDVTLPARNIVDTGRLVWTVGIVDVFSHIFKAVSTTNATHYYMHALLYVQGAWYICVVHVIYVSYVICIYVCVACYIYIKCKLHMCRILYMCSIPSYMWRML